jgi:hypothetical protein
MAPPCATASRTRGGCRESRDTPSDRDANEPVNRERTLVEPENENAYLRVVVFRGLRTRRSGERTRATITRPLRLKP